MARFMTLIVCCLTTLISHSQNDVLAHPGHDHEHQLAVVKPGNVPHDVTLGSGKFRYQTNLYWYSPPTDSLATGFTHGDVAVDSQGHTYLCTNDPKNGLQVYDSQGKFLKSLPAEFSGGHGIIVRQEKEGEFLYVAQVARKRVLKATLDGKIVWTIGFDAVQEGSQAYQNAKQFKPTAIVIGPDERIYVADGYGLSLIHIFDSNRKYLKTFGEKGTGPGQFNVCHNLDVDHRFSPPRLLICDRQNRRLQHYDLEGNFLEVIPLELRRPADAVVYGDYVAVAEIEGRVSILNKQNQVVASLGDNPDESQRANAGITPTDWQAGIFTAPHGITVTPTGDLIVTDFNRSGRITRLVHLK